MVLFKVSWWEKHNNLTGMRYQCGSNGWCSSPNICELTTRGHCATSSKTTPKWNTVFISFFNWSQGETLPVGGESRSRCRVAQAVWWVIGMSDAEWLRIPAATVFASCYSVLITWTYDRWAKNGLILKTWPSHKTDLPIHQCSGANLIIMNHAAIWGPKRDCLWIRDLASVVSDFPLLLSLICDLTGESSGQDLMLNCRFFWVSLSSSDTVRSSAAPAGRVGVQFQILATNSHKPTALDNFLDLTCTLNQTGCLACSSLECGKNQLRETWESFPRGRHAHKSMGRSRKKTIKLNHTVLKKNIFTLCSQLEFWEYLKAVFFFPCFNA